ncbi:hypothetical protein B9G39_03910 [Zooshikella ganghwensis]|uniref:Collagen-like protein n=2 Tax=Zooshikella ganghwensis TaxID=202772 RepID=A0A4P9VK75_9GAMM|nr:hypothetical protein B9G39_03910 [Zooshikella ganghwensis]
MMQSENIMKQKIIYPLVLSTFASAPMSYAANLQGYWSFDNYSNDKVLNSQAFNPWQATVNNLSDSHFNAAGQSGASFVVNSDPLVLPKRNDWLLRDGLGLSVWIKLTTSNTSDEVLFSEHYEYEESSRNIQVILTASGVIKVKVQASGNHNSSYIATSLSKVNTRSDWQLLTVNIDTKDQNPVSLSLNGAIVPLTDEGELNTMTFKQSHHAGPFTVGGDTQGLLAPFSGEIDEVRVYARPLIYAETLCLYFSFNYANTCVTEALPGAPGIIGEPGEQGDQGDPGEPGEKGEQGPQGEDGPQGDAGKQGESGKKGPDGIAGIDGSDGSDSSKGIKGKQGPAGDPGPKGVKGETGLPGIKGEKGPKGPLPQTFADLPNGATAGYCWLYQGKPFRLLEPAIMKEGKCGCVEGWTFIASRGTTQGTCLKSSGSYTWQLSTPYQEGRWTPALIPAINLILLN